MDKERTFVICNIIKLLEKQMSEVRETYGEDMNKDNLDGFDYAVENMISFLKQDIHAAEIDGGIFVHSDQLNPEYELEEFDLHDLLKHFNCRLTMREK